MRVFMKYKLITDEDTIKNKGDTQRFRVKELIFQECCPII